MKDWLTKYTNKEKHIPQHCYISHSHSYISSSD